MPHSLVLREGAPTMDDTTSPSWNYFQTFKMQLRGRLTEFKADRFNNEASFVDNELRSILEHDSAAHGFSEERSQEVEENANEFLDQLNDIAEIGHEETVQLPNPGAQSVRSRLDAALAHLQRHPSSLFGLLRPAYSDIRINQRIVESWP